jgi:hypothetical protein
VPNPREQAKCLAHESVATHVVGLAPALPPATAAAPSPAAGSIPSSGLTFGAPTAAVASSTGSFTFGAPESAAAPGVASFTSGFSFGAAAPVALPTTTGGFTFGAPAPISAPAASLAKAEAETDGETNAGSSAPSGAPKTSSALLMAKAYLTALELDADQEEDVGGEMQTAQDAWSHVMGSSVASALDVSMPAGSGEGTEEEEESELSRLVTVLGKMYCPETHGVEIRERAGSSKQLDESAFVHWYVRMTFTTDEDEDEDAEEGEGEGEGGLRVNEDGAGAESSSKAPKSGPVTGSWVGVRWAVAPTGACSVVGKMWKCDKWYVPNPWEQEKCLPRKSAAPHAMGLAPALAATGGHGILPGDARRGDSGACGV